MTAGFRPWCDDLADPQWQALREKLAENPAFAAQFEREQRQCLLLHNALHEVNAPANLLQNIFVSLSPVHAAVGNVAPAQALPKRISRRSILQLSTVAASLLATGGIVYQLFMKQGKSEPYSRDALANLIQQHVRDVVKFSEEWQTNWNDSTLQSHPTHALKIKPRRWCQVATELDATTIVYDLLGTENLAYLFVAATHRNAGLGALPLTKLPMSGEIAAGAWQRNALLYVLVVHEDLNLESFVQQVTVA